jgi:hypothetical protein
MEIVKNEYQTFSHYDKDMKLVLKNKRKYYTHDKAVIACKTNNLQATQIKKLVTYKCKICHKYHIGRNGNDISKKYLQKLSKANNIAGTIKRQVGIKVIGKIDLSTLK